MFQFLIGTLKTESEVSNMMVADVFQFLIGTLKTHRQRQRATASTVSIPDRYSKNPAPGRGPPLVISVSIPDRFSKNASPVADKGGEDSSFNS